MRVHNQGRGTYTSILLQQLAKLTVTRYIRHALFNIHMCLTLLPPSIHVPTAQNTTAPAPRFAHLLKTNLRPLTADGLEPDLHTRTYIRVLNEAGSRAPEGSHLHLHRALTRSWIPQTVVWEGLISLSWPASHIAAGCFFMLACTRYTELHIVFKATYRYSG